VPIKPGSDRVYAAYTISKANEKKVRELAKRTRRPMSVMLDIMIESFDETKA